MTSISGEFLSTDALKSWAEDERLVQIQDYLNIINDVKVKSLVGYMLSKSDCFWEAPVSDHNDGQFPPDEYELGGLVRNTKRATKAFLFLSKFMVFSLDEYYCAVAALLLRNITKAGYIDETKQVIAFDPFHLYTVEGFLHMINDQTHDNHEDNGRVLGVEDEMVALVTRLIRTSDGLLSMVPETMPVSTLEQTVHIATLMGRTCHKLLLHADEVSCGDE